MPAASTAFRIARGISRRGLSVSSPRAAAPSNPANERKASTAPSPNAPRPTPSGSENASALMPPWPGGEPPISLAKMTTTSTAMSVTETTSIESRARVVTLMSP